jgi:methyl-accepting chemotaxis protein/aerotaxis receptor
MRNNEPITQHEIELPDGDPLVSRTDTAGRITFVNHVFSEISGFTEDELVGAPHNLVRHPHMPPAAFANLWATIQAGRPWDGLVKNRAKSGDFYWVRANVTPVLEAGTGAEAGKVTGYISVRSKPTRAQVAAAEQSYAALRDGRAAGLELRDGEVVRTGWRGTLGDAGHSVLGRLAATMAAAVLLSLAVGWLGFSGMAASNDALRGVYENDLVAVNALRDIVDLTRDNRNQIAQLTVALGRGVPAEAALAAREPTVRANLARIAKLWGGYIGTAHTAATPTATTPTTATSTATGLTPELRGLAGTFSERYGALVRDGIEPALAIARRGETAQLDNLFQTRAPALFEAAFEADRQLVDRQIAVGRESYTGAVANLRWRLIIGTIIACGGVIAVLALGWALLATLRRCVQAFEAHFAAIDRGDFTADIATPPAREFRRMASMLRAMRAHLVFKGWESAELERKAGRTRRETVDRMAATIEQEAGSAVERVANRTSAMARDADAMAASAERVSDSAEHVATAADQALRNAQIVASASEQLAASIRTVSAQVEHASEVSHDGAAKGAAARATIRSLSEAAGRIGAVVSLIADIAGRTNLLALNATIEAARAGEAGRGFAVVAGEVKSLAAQTAKATGEISQQIADLRSATEAAVTAVEDIGHTLDAVAEVAAAVAEAIDQQTAATHEIARNVAESGSAVQEVTARIGEVSREATDAGQQAGRLRVDAGAVAEEIATLRGALVRTVRTATTEADRRLDKRAASDVPCMFTLIGAPGTGVAGSGDAAGRGGVAGTIMDVSVHGMLIAAAPCGAAAGQRGTLVLQRRTDARTSFEVRAVDPDGHVHIRYESGTLSPAFTAEVTAMIARAARTGFQPTAPVPAAAHAAAA